MKNEIKRNNKIIKAAKYLLLALAMLALLFIGYFMLIHENNKVKHADDNKIAEQEKQQAVKFQVVSPNLKGINLDNGPYFIKALQMKEIAGETSFIKPVIRLMIRRLDWLDVVANQASLVNENNDLKLFQVVRANLNNQYYLETEEAEILAQESVIKSDQYTKIYTINQDLESDKGFTVNYSNQTAFFYGAINANIRDADEDKLTNIKSDTFEVLWQKRLGNFNGNVVMLKEDVRVEANRMQTVISKFDNKIEKIYLYGDVKIITKEQTATSNYGEYVASSSILTLKDRVTLLKSGNKATGELLHYNFKLRQADLIGGEANKAKASRVRAVIIPVETSSPASKVYP